MPNAIKIIILIFSLLSINNVYSQPVIQREDGSQITYYLKQQKTNNDVLVLLVQGSDCNSIYNNPTINGEYDQLLPEADRLMVEKYAIDSNLAYSLADQNPDCPAAYIEHNNPPSRVDDLARVLSEIKKQYHYSTIIVLGGSEGAYVTYQLAARYPSLAIKAIIGLNGGGQKFIDDVEHAIPDPEGKAKLREFYQLILEGKPITIGGDYSHLWWHSMFTSDQLEVLKQVNIPTLIIQAKQDINVNPQAVDKMVEALKADNKNNITYYTYDDLDHGFKDQKGQSHHQKIIKDINQWLATILKPV